MLSPRALLLNVPEEQPFCLRGGRILHEEQGNARGLSGAFNDRGRFAVAEVAGLGGTWHHAGFAFEAGLCAR